MSKSRKPKPQLVRAPADSTPAFAPEDGNVYPLTGHLRATLDAIVCGTALVQTGLIPESLAGAMLDDPQYASILSGAISDLDDDETLDEDLDDDSLDAEEARLDAELERMASAVAGVANSTRILARSLIAQALGRPRDDSAPMVGGGRVEIDAATLDEIVTSLQLTNIPAPLRPSRSELTQALGQAAALVKEVGLEEFDVHCELASAQKDVIELVAHPISPEAAHVALIDYLFDRADASASVDDPEVLLERVASSWEFERWSVAPPAGLMPPELAGFTRDVRSDEFRLVDRTLLALGSSVVASIANDAAYRELFPRQHRMACAYMESFVDIFEVTEVEGPRSTWRSILYGALYDVHDHRDPVIYQVGWIAAGRLIPFDGERHLRSPGTIFVAPDLGLARKAAETLGRLEESTHSALALEAAISSDIFGVPVPRDVKPMQSRASARVVHAQLEAMIGAGFELDSTLSAFMKALKRQADGSESGSGSAGKHSRGRAAKRSKRSRRR